MFTYLARFACRRPWWIIAAWLAVVGCVVPLLPHISDPLQVGGFSSDQSEGARTTRVLQEELGLSPSQLAIIFTSDTLTTEDPMFFEQMDNALTRVHQMPFVADVLTPELDPTLVGPSGHLAYVIAGLPIPVEDARDEALAVRDAIIEQPGLDVLVAGGPTFYADVEVASQRDLRRAELLAFPFATIALILVFGSLVAASVPMLVGSAGVAASLLAIYGLAHVTDMSIFVLNLATMLGLGLAVDYSLFITSRFREEVARRSGNVDEAVVAAMATAGRAVFFSGTTVLIGLSGLALFNIMFLRSVGIAGFVVVGISTLGALTLLPAVLKLVGTRIDHFQLGPLARRDAGPVQEGFWYRLARRVQTRPIIVTLVMLVVLGALGAPFLRANISSPDATMLPRDLPSRQGYDLLAEEFSGGEISPFFIMIQTTGDMRSAESLAQIDALDDFLINDERISHIQSVLTVPGASPDASPEQRLEMREQAERLGFETRIESLINNTTAMILAYPVEPANAETNRNLLRELRDWDAGPEFTVSVAGGTAEIVDVVDVIYSDFPLVAFAIVATTFLILAMLFRSVVLPLKAIVMNTMSILVAYGALVWIFQDGHFHQWLGFTPQGYVEASLPVIMFCVLFGLSMDYEVFLLSRIQEEWVRTGENDAAVALGLERSGRIISSAALIVVVVTASFVSADVVIVKALGLCIAVAIAIDATIVRALLVPSTMKLLGQWNWWIPERLDRILPRIGRTHHEHALSTTPKKALGKRE